MVDNTGLAVTTFEDGTLLQVLQDRIERYLPLADLKAAVLVGGIDATSLNVPRLGVFSVAFAATALVDGGAAIGTITYADALPYGAIVLGGKLIVDAGFAGDVSAVMTIGDGSDADRFNTGTLDVFAAAATGMDLGLPSGVRFLDESEDVVITVTSAANITPVLAGGGLASLYIYYIVTA